MPRRPSSGDRAGGLGSAAVVVQKRAQKRSYANRIGWRSRITDRSRGHGQGPPPWAPARPRQGHALRYVNPVYVKGLSQPDAQTRTTWVDLQLARAILCADCDEPTAKAALNRLRPQARYPSTVPFPLAEFPSVSCTSVVCSDDQFVGTDWSRRVARNRLGAELIELPGSHSPFLSRPSALADVLLRVA
jgi:hypothetical protein